MAQCERLPEIAGDSAASPVIESTPIFGAGAGTASSPSDVVLGLERAPSMHAVEEHAAEDRAHQNSETPSLQHFPLVFCPEPPRGTVYRLQRSGDGGGWTTLYEGVAQSEAASLNLAKVRHRGAVLGASRVVLIPPCPSIRLSSLEP